ncbi:MucR family transcriptional regulator [Novosphingobium pentaromativorans]|uniref:MucR family transcriptional regulator n=1 Tax=Novosphingobium pentaromativorans US6-1 TaxID=1088721 RepID=G6EDD6_9SPHN|nr:MucR family transcriptional regulator [Novosphingobium pentaromativorans]AIT79781.1 MucR family transcriptional regulator [Novosphingobium pentaromativorans US6-1]EHJ60735.1 MucR family transcriptional regulator [Novosphingobium pentaromativorans US6-1]
MDDFDARRASLDLVTAFVNNNKLSAAELPTLLGDVFKAISGFEVQAGETVEPEGKQAEIVAEPEAAPAPETKPAATPAAPAKATKTKASAPKPAPKASAANTPAVSIEESLADPNVIVSLITGEKFKMLRRHLTKHGLTEAEYKARFNLPDDYPMVAPAYVALRRDVATRMHASAKDAGAGDKAVEAPAPEVTEEVATPIKAKAVSKKSASKKKVASPKKAAGAETAAPPIAPARQSRVKAAAASAAPVNAADAVPAPVETPNASPAPASEAIPQTEQAKAVETPKKAAAKKPAPKRRMARQPAAETTTVTPAPVEASEATEASSAVAPVATKPTKGRSRKSRGGAAMSEDGAKAKPARKERKTLTPAYR